jgi:hypothetical protein
MPKSIVVVNSTPIILLILDCTGNEGKSEAKGFPLESLSARKLSAARAGGLEVAAPIFYYNRHIRIAPMCQLLSLCRFSLEFCPD